MGHLAEKVIALHLNKWYSSQGVLYFHNDQVRFVGIVGHEDPSEYPNATSPISLNNGYGIKCEPGYPRWGS